MGVFTGAPEVAARLGDLAREIGGELIGSPERVVTRIAALHDADAHSIGFVASARFAARLQDCRAGCLIIAPAWREQALAWASTQASAAAGSCPVVGQVATEVATEAASLIVCDDPYLAYARLSQWWQQHKAAPVAAGVHAHALIEEGATIHASASVGPFAFVARGASIGAHAVVGSHNHIGAGAQLGEGTVLKPRVSLLEACVLGAGCIVHSGAVIGADGFGFAPDQGRWVKIEQLGAVWIGDSVEIGANTCIDRGALDDTLIEEGVKIDNLVQIAHNVRVGAHTAFAGKAGVAGSARIGKYCTIGGAASILGHLELADHVHITACTVVSRSIRKSGLYSGSFPFDDNASWEKNAATLRQLHTLRDRLRALERKNKES